jgi:hypothetical protein
VSIVESFFIDIDGQWKPRSDDRVRLSLIGCGALILQADYQRGTKDSDVFETADLTTVDKNQLTDIAGAGTETGKRWNLYVDIVANGIPFLPHVPIWLALDELNKRLVHLEIVVLDVVDVLVSKLKRFSANDQSDIDAMIDLGLVPHARFVERFSAAVDEFSGDARADDLPTYVRHFHRVERDMFGVDETEIELPSWV